jgi:hypothetical protein
MRAGGESQITLESHVNHGPEASFLNVPDSCLTNNIFHREVIVTPLQILSCAVTATLLLGCAQSAAPPAPVAPVANAPATTSAADPSGGLTLSRIREVAGESRPGSVQLFFTPGHSARAEMLQRMVEEGVRFFADSLQLRAEVNLAVLDAPAWAELSDVPYGIPFFSPIASVIFLPATLDGPIPADYLSHRAHYSSESMEKIRASGLTFEEGAHTMVDLIGYHELGHLLTHAFGIRPPSAWMSEFLATYFAYAFLRREHPKLASLWDGIVPIPASYQPQHTSLQDFDRLYFGVGPQNYFWYQGAFAARVTEVFSGRGLDFLRSVRQAFPAGVEEQPSSHQVLERLDGIHPGFIAWADSLEPDR